MIVTARFKARWEEATTVAWHGSYFSRLKNLRPLPKYLNAASKQTPEEGARALRGMIARMAARKAGKHGTR